MEENLVHIKISYMRHDQRQSLVVVFIQERDFDYHNGLDRNLSIIKLKFPIFQEKNDPDVYLDWEKNIEFVFDCH